MRADSGFLKFSLVFLTGSQYNAQKLSSDCRNDELIISVPLKDPKMANILMLSAGNCTDDNIPGGIDEVLTYDEVAQIADIAIPILECDLKKDLYADPVTEPRSGKYYFMPSANVTLGYEHNGVEIVYRHFHIAAECGLRKSYEVDFKYDIKEDEEEKEDCQYVDGICVFPAYEEDAGFKIVEFDSKYDEEIDYDEDRKRRPGDDIYLAIIPEEVPEGYDWAVTHCAVESQDGTELNMSKNEKIVKPIFQNLSFFHFSHSSLYAYSRIRPNL